MDTANATLMNLPAASPAPPKLAAESVPPPARADGPGPKRSFAATLARQQPKAPDTTGAPPSNEPAAPVPDGGNAAAAPSESNPPGQDAKPVSKPAAKPKAANSGDSAPVDGKALPLWLPPLVQTPTPAPVAASGVTAAAAVASAAIADAATVAQKAGATADADVATGAAAGRTAALAAASAAGEDDSGVEAAPATPGAPAPAPAQPSTLEAALAKAATAAAANPGSTAAASTNPQRTQVAADPADATARLAAPPTVAAPAAQTAIKPAAAAAEVPTASVAAVLTPKAARPATVTVESLRGHAAAVAGGPSMAPVATDLKQAVAAVLSADANGDAGTMQAAKGAADPTAGVVPQMAMLAPDRATAPTVAQVATPVGAPDWAHELSDRVSVLVNQNLTHAQIKLSPADLGPIEVRIALADGQANVSFTTHSHVTSEALQAAAPRLRESLGSQGYTSVNVDVSQQQFRERSPQQTRYEPEPSFVASVAPGVPRAATRVASVASATLRLDAYA